MPSHRIQTKDLFILNENYPLDATMYNKYKAKLDQCGQEDKCVSWVKYDIEGELRDYAKRVGVKLDGSEESNFTSDLGSTRPTERSVNFAFIGFIILLILMAWSVNKKSWMIAGGSAILIALLLWKKPEAVTGI